MKNSLFLFIGGILALCAFVFSFWPFAALAIALFGLSGSAIAALGLGVVLDLIYGVPPGLFSALLFPFTILSALSIAARFLMKRYMISQGPSNR